jgi:serpin B
VNAIYFKADWKERFDVAHTADGDFTTQDGAKVKVPLMHRKGPARYADVGDALLLELPYQGSDAAMVVVLPKQTGDKDGGLATLESKLTSDIVTGWLAKLAEHKEIAVTLPRFTAETTLSMKELLQDLGMKLAFERDAADFSGMLGGKARESLWIDAVLHKAFILVNEEGAEAAAATAVVVKGRKMNRTPAFEANRPFVYFIRDTRTGTILFVGRVTDPR